MKNIFEPGWCRIEILIFRNAKKATERIENMKTELEEAEIREQEILEEKETLDKDCKLSSERAAQLKVLYSTSLSRILYFNYV